MKLNKLPLLVLSLLMWGCSSDEGLVSPDSAQAEQTINYRIPLEEALSAADAMMGEIVYIKFK